jgi:hypothetical protein
VSDVALTWLSFAIWLVLTAALFIILARWSAGEGAWGGLSGIVRGFHDWATEVRTSARASSSAGVGGGSPSPRAEIEEL